jgi:hypothetical protein
VDFHLDYAISQFLSETFHTGVVGYLVVSENSAQAQAARW